MSADRPLTDAQERALDELASISEVRPDRDRARRATGMPTEWFRTSRFCRNVRTAQVLESLGLVELRIEPSTLRSGAWWAGRITEAGREMLASMGD